MKTSQKIRSVAVLLTIVGFLIVTVCVIAIAAKGTSPQGTTPSASVTDIATDSEKKYTSSTDDAQTDVATVTNTEEKTISKTDTSSEKTEPKTTDKTTETGTKTSKKTETDRPTSSTETPDEPGVKRIAFTFDDGPYTLGKNIADEVAKYNGHVTFFVVGNRISGSWGDAMAYAYEKGNEIGIHGYTHKVYYNKCSDAEFEAELSETDAAIAAKIGRHPTLMRPIGGAISSERIRSCDYAVIHWSVDSQDWKYKKESDANVQIIVKNVLSNVKNGDIILMHEIYKNSYNAFCILLKELDKQGYEFVTVSELLGTPSAGVMYHSTTH